MARLLRGGRLAVSGVSEENTWRPSRSATSMTPPSPYWSRKPWRDAAEAVEVAAAQRVRQREHLQRAGHPLHLRIEHQADAAHGFQHALRRVLAILLVILKNDADRENDQRQRGSRDQKGETHWQ